MELYILIKRGSAFRFAQPDRVVWLGRVLRRRRDIIASLR